MHIFVVPDLLSFPARIQDAFCLKFAQIRGKPGFIGNITEKNDLLHNSSRGPFSKLPTHEFHETVFMHIYPRLEAYAKTLHAQECISGFKSEP